jgi:HSP20 family protein
MLLDYIYGNKNLISIKEINRIMRTWYASPYRRIARRPHYIARNAGSEDLAEHENVLPVDVKSDGDAFMISAIVPGIEADNIDVEILNKTVSIRGKFNERVEDEDGKVLVSELPFGHFSRVLTLPTKLEPSEAVANLKDGVFTLRVPKAEEDRPRAIKISAE